MADPASRGLSAAPGRNHGRDSLARPLQAEVIQPAQLPDGLLEAQLAGETDPGLYVVEIGTYAEDRLCRQIYRDVLLVLLDCDVVPTVVAVVLRPRGSIQIPRDVHLRSRDGSTEVEVRWRIVELWNVPVEAVLATADPGLMPWAPLCELHGPPEPVFQECRRIIDRVPAEEERANLLAVTQVLSRLRYNDPRLLTILGGRRIMIESPLLDELKEEWTAEARVDASIEILLTQLSERFGAVPEELEQSVRSVRSRASLGILARAIVQCDTLQAFRARLESLAS